VSADPIQAPRGWHVINQHRNTLIYSLHQDGWRHGQPVMVNDVTIHVEAAPNSQTDIGPIVSAILAALPAQEPSDVG
jgi:hypothetical protein